MISHDSDNRKPRVAEPHTPKKLGDLCSELFSQVSKPHVSMKFFFPRKSSKTARILVTIISLSERYHICKSRSSKSSSCHPQQLIGSQSVFLKRTSPTLLNSGIGRGESSKEGSSFRLGFQFKQFHPNPTPVSLGIRGFRGRVCREEK